MLWDSDMRVARDWLRALGQPLQINETARFSWKQHHTLCRLFGTIIALLFTINFLSWPELLQNQLAHYLNRVLFITKTKKDTIIALWGMQNTNSKIECAKSWHFGNLIKSDSTIQGRLCEWFVICRSWRLQLPVAGNSHSKIMQTEFILKLCLQMDLLFLNSCHIK